MEQVRYGFEEFKSVVLAGIRDVLPAGFESAQIDLQTVEKNNGLKLSGLVIRKVGSNIAPTIYMESYFKRYEEGEEFESILQAIADCRVEHDVEDIDVSYITMFDVVKSSIVPKLINAKANANLLETRVHTMIADLAVTYMVVMDDFSCDGMATVGVTKQMLDVWGVDVEELHAVAVANMLSKMPSTFKGLSEVMKEMMGMDMDELGLFDEEERMYVISNRQKNFGATALLDKALMHELVDRFGSFFILPSSLHELLIVPETAGMEVAELEGMVREVNSSTVAEDERLSDHVYSYSMEAGLYIA